MDIEDVVHTHTHTHTRILISHKKRKKIGSFIETRMALTSVKQSEVSQKEKKKLHINTYMQVILNIMKQCLELCIDTNCMTLQILCV